MNILYLFSSLFIADICIEASGTNPDAIHSKLFMIMDICLDLTLNEEGTSEVPGSNKFDLIVRALVGHQNTLLIKALECTSEDKEMVSEILQDVVTTNEMLGELISSGFPEVFNSSFYSNRR